MRNIWWCLLAVLLAGCIANSSSTSDGGSKSPPSHGVSITPGDATVAADATQQFKATVDGDAGQAVTWQVNGVSGGAPATGTISADGLYTAPRLPPTGGAVTITAVSQADASVSGDTHATIDYSNASLKGDYIFSWRGALGGGDAGVIGRFSADGQGGISAGSEDVNAPDGVFFQLPFDGSYSVSGNGTGSVVLTSQRGSAELRFVFGPDGRLRVIRVDSGAVAAGDIIPRGETTAGAEALSGDYVFSLDGTDQTAGRTEIVGGFNADGNGALTGEQDRNANGGVTLARNFAGTYTVDDDSRGTLTLTNTLGAATHYVFYAVAADEIRLLAVDPGRVLSGRALAQADTAFDDNVLSGDYVFDLFGSDTVGVTATAGRFTAHGNGNIDGGEFDRNQGGAAQQAQAFAGVYTVDSDGRGTARFTTAAGQTDLVFYLQSADRALVMDVGPAAVRAGEFVAQSDPDAFSTDSLDGAYALSSPEMGGTVVGRIALDGDGNVDGVEVRNDAGSVSSAIALGGSYGLDAGGRGALTLQTEGGGVEHYTIYAVSPQRLLLIGLDPASVALAVLRQQY